MSADDWSRFEGIVRQSASREPTQARAVGVTIARLMDSQERVEVAPGPLDWMDWERRKTLRLLLPGR
jgi:hypothetical protein